MADGCVPWSAMGVRAVFLVGFMASGKSCVGQELARRLDWDFVDLDARIESRERQTVPEIFRDRGEPGFRLAETSALRDLLTESLPRSRVVALGGGAFVQERNRELLRQWPSVFLEAPASELWQRSLADGVERPLRGDPEQFAQLYAERLPFYRQASVVVETTGKQVASICVEIEGALQLRGTPEDAGSGLSRIDLSSFGTGESQ
jgi:shikimate kinase